MVMNTVNIKKQTKEIIDHIPDEKLGVVLSFLQWIEDEDISTNEWSAIEQGEKEIKDNQIVSWRKVARTV